MTPDLSYESRKEGEKTMGEDNKCEWDCAEHLLEEE